MNDLVKLSPSQQQYGPEAKQSDESTSLWDVLTGTYNTWKAVRHADQTVRVIDAQARVAEATGRLVRAQTAASRDALVLQQVEEEKAKESVFYNKLRNVPDEHRLTFLQRERATELLLADRERIRQARLSGSLLSIPTPLAPVSQPQPIASPPSKLVPPAPQLPVAQPAPQVLQPAMPVASPAEIQPYLELDAIDRIATKAVMAIGHLRGQIADDAWAAFMRELYARFPRNIAVEIDRRVQSLRFIGGSGR